MFMYRIRRIHTGGISFGQWAYLNFTLVNRHGYDWLVLWSVYSKDIPDCIIWSARRHITDVGARDHKRLFRGFSPQTLLSTCVDFPGLYSSSTLFSHLAISFSPWQNDRSVQSCRLNMVILLQDDSSVCI